MASVRQSAIERNTLRCAGVVARLARRCPPLARAIAPSETASGIEGYLPVLGGGGRMVSRGLRA
jgi:hypothetical protein